MLQVIQRGEGSHLNQIDNGYIPMSIKEGEAALAYTCVELSSISDVALKQYGGIFPTKKTVDQNRNANANVNT